MAKATSKSSGSSSGPTLDVYVGLTIVAFLSLAIAIGLLVAEINEYRAF